MLSERMIFMSRIGGNRADRDRSSRDRRISRAIDRCEQGRYRRLLGIVNDLRAVLAEADLDGGHPRYSPKRLVDMLHAAVAGHPGNRQCGDHGVTLA